MKRKLTPKQQKFADNYIETGNATQSAIDAGYSKRTAQVIGAENLLKPMVKTYIAEQMKEIESNKIMDAEEALRLLTSIARGEEKETVITSTPDGIYEDKKEADLKTRIVALKEILKRFPDNDQLLKQQVRKLEADADIAKFKARMLMGDTDGIDKTVILDDLEGDQDE